MICYRLFDYPYVSVLYGVISWRLHHVVPKALTRAVRQAKLIYLINKLFFRLFFVGLIVSHDATTDASKTTPPRLVYTLARTNGFTSRNATRFFRLRRTTDLDWDWTQAPALAYKKNLKQRASSICNSLKYLIYLRTSWLFVPVFLWIPFRSYWRWTP